MKKSRRCILPLAGGLALAAAAIFLTAPGRADKSRKEAFRGRNFAHRGLHSNTGKRPENSLAAFRAAAEKGYGIELDARLTSDGQVAVFHDDGLERMCGVPGRVEDMPMSELKKLSLGDTQETIPTLEEALDTVDDRVPVIIELKKGKKNEELCEKVLQIIDEHFGDFCVESFDPRILRWFRKNAPDILRGQLIAPAEDLGDSVSPPQAFALRWALTNVFARPHFIAHKIGKKSPGVLLCEALGAMRIAWTSRSYKNEKKNDAVIFEGYLPRVKYK